MKVLGVFDVDASAPMRKSFYTAIYHAMMASSLFMDADGRYRGPDNTVHHADGFRNYSTFSLWDKYRALHPILTIVQPEQRTNDIVNSLLASRRYSPNGILSVWAFHGLETWCMIGYHVTAGNCRCLHEGEAASKTLEYAFDDWTIAQVATVLGKRDIAEVFDKRAGNWRNAYDAKTGFMRARKTDGVFREPFDPSASGYGTDYMDTQYAPRPDGLAGNDDLGQMLAWFLFTAKGFYTVAPASNEYVIGRPFVDRVTLNLPNGKNFMISTDGLDATHPYIGAVTLNGKPLLRSVI